MNRLLTSNVQSLKPQPCCEASSKLLVVLAIVAMVVVVRMVGVSHYVCGSCCGVFGRVLFVIVVVCGGEEIYFDHCSTLVNTIITAFELCFMNPKAILFFFQHGVKREKDNDQSSYIIRMSPNFNYSRWPPMKVREMVMSR